MFLKHILRIVEVYSNVLVLISQVAALNWSDSINRNVGHPVKNVENRHFCTKRDLKELYPIVMFLKLMLRIVEVFGRFEFQPSGRAQLKWSIYTDLGYPREKRRKSTFLHEKWSESALSISDVPETYVENSWGLCNVLVLISQVAALNWSDTIYPNLGYPRKNAENRHFCTKSDLKVLYSISDVPETYVENSWGL